MTIPTTPSSAPNSTARRAWVVPGNKMPMSVTRIPCKVEENRDGMMGYHGWSSLRKGEVVLIIAGETHGGGPDPWQLVECAGRRYWISRGHLQEIPSSPSVLKDQVNHDESGQGVIR